jgi:GAF domain-containing protein
LRAGDEMKQNVAADVTTPARDAGGRMAGAQRMGHEDERVRALRSSGWLERGPDPRLDEIVARAAALFEAPIAAVGLIDDVHLHFRASLGVGVPYTRRENSFCAQVVVQPQLLVVPDARQDARFNDRPLVTDENGIRFYAGAPVFGHDGLVFGALCVLDTEPRMPLDAAQQDALRALAAECTAVLSGPVRRRA